MSIFYRGPSIDALYQVSYHLAKRFQRKRCFRNRPIRNKNCLRRPYLLTDQNGMSNSHRGPFIDASYHVSVQLAKLFKSRRFLEIDQSETRIPCGGHVCYWIGTKWALFIKDLPLMLPTTFRIIWPSGFIGKYFQKSTNQKQELPVVAMFVHGSERN